MGRLIYSYLASLDGYVAGPDGRWDWAVPDEEVLGFINELEAGIGTFLYGRGIYELMTAWENDPAAAAQSDESDGFASLWQRAEKIVYSSTLETVSTERTRIERAFPQIAGGRSGTGSPAAVAELKAAVDHDLAVSGANLAASAFRAGLVDEVHLFVAPVIVGGGKALFPDDVHVRLDLRDERRFGNGMVFLRYDVLR